MTKGSLRSLLALAVMAAAAFTVPMASASPASPTMQAYASTAKQEAPAATAAMPATQTERHELAATNRATLDGNYLLAGAKTPAKPSPTKKGGGKKKMLASGPGDGDESGEGQPAGIRRLRT